MTIESNSQRIIEILPFTRRFDIPGELIFRLDQASLSILHNMRVDAIEEKLSIELDLDNGVVQYARHEGAVTARILLLTELINLSTQE